MDIRLLFSLKWKTFNCHIFYSLLKLFSSFPSSLKFFFISFGFPFFVHFFFFFFAPHNNSREWRKRKKVYFSRFLWFVNSTLVCLIIARFKVKIYANFTRGKSRLLREKEWKSFAWFKSCCQKMKWNWGRFLRVNLLNKITTIYNIFEGFLPIKFWHVLVYYVLKKFLKTQWLWDMWLKHNRKFSTISFFSCWEVLGSCHHII